MWIYLLAITLAWFAVWKYLRTLMLSNHGKRYVLITGCDTGFGRELARKLDGMRIHVFAGCLTEQGASDLKEQSSCNLVSLRLDVSQSESVMEAHDIVKRALPETEGLWGVVNNAGVAGETGPIEWLTVEDIHKAVNINVYGTLRVTKAFLPLVRKSRGRIVNMSSMMGRFAGGNVPYSISKYSSEAVSDVLRRELYHTGVTVHILEPGSFRTQILNPEKVRAGLERLYARADREQRDYYGQNYVEEGMKIIEQTTETLMSSDLSKVVDAYTHALFARYPKKRYVIGWDAHVLCKVMANLPEWLSDYIVASLMPIPAGAQR